MIIQAICFYAFAAVAVASGVMVISSRNPVHSVLFLILAFFNAAGLMVLAGAEFIAMLLVIVYVGAVAVLFLFVVMMLDIDFAELRAGVMKYAAVGLAHAMVAGADVVAEMPLDANAAQVGVAVGQARQRPAGGDALQDGDAGGDVEPHILLAVAQHDGALSRLPHHVGRVVQERPQAFGDQDLALQRCHRHVQADQRCQVPAAQAGGDDDLAGGEALQPTADGEAVGGGIDRVHPSAGQVVGVQRRQAGMEGPQQVKRAGAPRMA